MSSYLIQIPRVLALFIIPFMLISGCTYFGSSIDHALELSNEEQYEQSIQTLNNIIRSDAPALVKAQAFLLRGQNYTSLREYRYAYRDFQVAWKVSCDIYQQSDTTKTAKDSNSTPESFSPAKACIETVPVLIDQLKPFTSDFAAIMATQNASLIVKNFFPELHK